MTFVAYSINANKTYLIIGGVLLILILIQNLYQFVAKRFIEIDDFFEAVKYRDFSRWFSEEHGSPDIRKLHRGFNRVNTTFKDINKEREAQFLYLQKILEMVDVGIIAYNIETGDVLWVNDALLNILDLPSFKNIRFVQKRRPQLHDDLFETYYSSNQPVTLHTKEETIKVMLTDTIFQIGEDAFKLIVAQNIEDTLNKSESEAWKKLLSVMTHEIMNSIAPISSLSQTLQGEVQKSIDAPDTHTLDLIDLNAGITSIKSRSEGLMKFAKTYRTLNKVSQVNRSRVKVNQLFANINNLMQPSLDKKNIDLSFINKNAKLELNIDVHLIEQVMINLILNARDACSDSNNPKIVVAAEKFRDSIQIKVSDNGKGIPKEVLDNIFIPFFSTKKTGSGIGLSLSKQIMMLHNGRIQVQSEEGKGTVISLFF